MNVRSPAAAWFLLPLFVGLWSLGGTIWLVADYIRMQSWQQVDATLIELEQRHGESRRARNSRTLSISARYTYSYRGNDFVGQRVALHSGRDQISSFQSRLYAELVCAQAANRTVPCFVNPAQPSEAVLNRELVPLKMLFWIIFGLLFTFAGGFSYFEARRNLRPTIPTGAMPDPFPGESWNVRDKGRVRGAPRDGEQLQAFAVFTLLWNLFSWLLVIVFFSRAMTPGFILFVIALFPIVGLCALVALVRNWLRLRSH
jgi:hypothetical protein